MTNTHGVADLFLVLGQSNGMTFDTIGVPYPGGWSTQALNGGYSEAIWNIITQSWEQYVAGVNSEVVPSGSSAYGPEAGIALARRAYVPQRCTYFLKYCVGGTGLARNASPSVNDWSPYSDGKAFGSAMAQFDAAVASLAGYRFINVEACFWIGNETDTQDAVSAAAMARDLPAFAEALRSRMNAPDMKFIVALCKQGSPNGPYTDPVRAEQMAVGSLRRNAYVETNDLTWTGGHYNPDQVPILGARMAAAADAVIL